MKQQRATSANGSETPASALETPNENNPSRGEPEPGPLDGSGLAIRCQHGSKDQFPDRYLAGMKTPRATSADGSETPASTLEASNETAALIPTSPPRGEPPTDATASAEGTQSEEKSDDPRRYTKIGESVRQKIVDELELSISQCRTLFKRQSTLQAMRERGLSPRGMSDYLLKNDYKNYVSHATITRWLRLEKLSERALAGSRRSSGRRTRVEDNVLLYVLGALSINSRIKLTVLRTALIKHREELGIGKVPSIYTLRRHVNRLPKSLRSGLYSRGKAFFEKHGQVVRNVGTLPNECCQVDICLLKLWVWDIETRKRIQPFIILFIDRDFSVVFGWHATKQTPNKDDLILAAKKAILPGKVESGCAYGLWKYLQSDNGEVFLSADFIWGMQKLGVTTFNSVQYCPSQNGTAEAMFRTVKREQCNEFTDYARQRTATAHGADLTLTWESFLVHFQEFVYDYNQRRVHSKFGKPPFHAWSAAEHRSELISVDAQRVGEALVITRELNVRRDGIEVVPNRLYQGACLRRFTGKKLIVAHPPEGPGDTVLVYHKDRLLGEIECLAARPELANQLRETFAEDRREVRDLQKTLQEGHKRLAKIKQKTLGTPDVQACPRPRKRQPTPAPIVVPSVTKGAI